MPLERLVMSRTLDRSSAPAKDRSMHEKELWSDKCMPLKGESAIATHPQDGKCLPRCTIPLPGTHPEGDILSSPGFGTMLISPINKTLSVEKVVRRDIKLYSNLLGAAGGRYRPTKTISTVLSA